MYHQNPNLNQIIILVQNVFSRLTLLGSPLSFFTTAENNISDEAVPLVEGAGSLTSSLLP